MNIGESNAVARLLQYLDGAELPADVRADAVFLAERASKGLQMRVDPPAAPADGGGDLP